VKTPSAEIFRLNSPRSAAKWMLSVAYHQDVKTLPRYYPYVYVYFDAKSCRFDFSRTQRRDCSGLIKFFIRAEQEEVLDITTCKFSFAKLAIGAMNRKVISQREYMALTRSRFEWF